MVMPNLRPSVKRDLSKNKSFQDILSPTAKALEVLSVETLDYHVHNTKAVVLVEENGVQEERVVLYNRIPLDLDSVLDDAPSNNLQWAIDYLNENGWSVSEDDIGVDGDFYRVLPTSLGYNLGEELIGECDIENCRTEIMFFTRLPVTTRNDLWIGNQGNQSGVWYDQAALGTMLSSIRQNMSLKDLNNNTLPFRINGVNWEEGWNGIFFEVYNSTEVWIGDPGTARDQLLQYVTPGITVAELQNKLRYIGIATRDYYEYPIHCEDFMLTVKMPTIPGSPNELWNIYTQYWDETISDTRFVPLIADIAQNSNVSIQMCQRWLGPGE